MANLSEVELESAYHVAYGLYEKGRFDQAAGFFTQLIFHHPFEPRFWKGLAASRQMEKNYEAALHAWATLCILSPEDPLAHYHAAECLLSQGQKEEALKAIECAERLPQAPVDKIAFLKTRMTHVLC